MAENTMWSSIGRQVRSSQNFIHSLRDLFATIGQRMGVNSQRERCVGVPESCGNVWERLAALYQRCRVSVPDCVPTNLRKPRLDQERVECNPSAGFGLQGLLG
jgi:hypothetical protein